MKLLILKLQEIRMEKLKAMGVWLGPWLSKGRATRKHQKASESIRKHQKASERIRKHQKAMTSYGQSK